MTITDSSLEQLAHRVGQYLLLNNKKLCTAESCTGGWVAKCCTDIAGSSGWFERGFITYSNDSKHDLLDVSDTTLEQHGAVSEETVIEMARGALNNSKADISIATTGIAGPDGGSESKPVGTVWFGLASSTVTKSKVHYFSGDRDAIRRQAVMVALQFLIEKT